MAENEPQKTKKYLGVVRNHQAKCFQCQMYNNEKKQIYLGMFDKAELAAKAHDRAAIVLNINTLNFPLSRYSSEIEQLKKLTEAEVITLCRKSTDRISKQRKTNVSGYRGVSRSSQSNCFQSYIKDNENTSLHLGFFNKVNGWICELLLFIRVSNLIMKTDIFSISCFDIM